MVLMLRSGLLMFEVLVFHLVFMWEAKSDTVSYMIKQASDCIDFAKQ